MARRAPRSNPGSEKLIQAKSVSKNLIEIVAKGPKKDEITGNQGATIVEDGCRLCIAGAAVAYKR